MNGVASGETTIGARAAGVDAAGAVGSRTTEAGREDIAAGAVVGGGAAAGAMTRGVTAVGRGAAAGLSRDGVGVGPTGSRTAVDAELVPGASTRRATAPRAPGRGATIRGRRRARTSGAAVS